MNHIYFRPVVDMYNKINANFDFQPGSPEYQTSQILIRNNIS